MSLIKSKAASVIRNVSQTPEEIRYNQLDQNIVTELNKIENVECDPVCFSQTIHIDEKCQVFLCLAWYIIINDFI